MWLCEWTHESSAYFIQPFEAHSKFPFKTFMRQAEKELTTTTTSNKSFILYFPVDSRVKVIVSRQYTCQIGVWPKTSMQNNVSLMIWSKVDRFNCSYWQNISAEKPSELCPLMSCAYFFEEKKQSQCLFEVKKKN